MTTHYMDEAEWCDRIAIMDQGEIVALDTPEALKAQRRQATACTIAHRRRRRGDRRAQRALRASRPRVAEGAVTFGVAERRAVRPAAVRRARRADHARSASSRPDARRRLHVLHGHDDPRRRGGRLASTDNRVTDADDERRRDDGDDHRSAATRRGADRHRDRPACACPRQRSASASELRAIKIVWRRELIRFRRDRRADRHLARCSRSCSCSCSAPGCSTLASAGHPRRQPEDLRLPGHAVHGRDVHRACSRPPRSSGTASSASCAR